MQACRKIRLEALTDLVFGFSLSLLVTCLDVLARLEDIFDSTACVDGGARSLNLLSRFCWRACCWLSSAMAAPCNRAGDLSGYMLGMFDPTVLLFRTFVRRLPAFLA